MRKHFGGGNYWANDLKKVVMRWQELGKEGKDSVVTQKVPFISVD